MRILITILFLFLCIISYAQEQYILVGMQNAESIRGRYGKYSEINPILTFDSLCIIPYRCVYDKDLIMAKTQLLSETNIGRLLFSSVN